MSSADRKMDNERKKERMKLLRQGKSFEDWEADCELDRQRKETKSGKKNDIEKEFEKISLKHEKRKSRNIRNGKEKLQQNLKAKKGMRIFREEGRLKAHASRTEKNTSERDDWKKYITKSKTHVEIVEKQKPDIIQQLNEKVREEKEQLRMQKETETENERLRLQQIEEDGGEWEYNPEFAEYYWVGEGEPKGVHETEFEVLTDKELEDIRRQEEIWLEADIEEQERRRKEKRKEKRDELKAAMKVPIKAFPEKEKCQYEKIREDNIKEREKAMEESGFYKDLGDYKKKIGLI